MLTVRLFAAVVVVGLFPFALAQEKEPQVDEEYVLSPGLDKYFQRIRGKFESGSMRGVLAVGTVEALDTLRESKIAAKGTRTDWKSDPGSCSDVVFVYPERKPLVVVVAQETANPAEGEIKVRHANFVVWIGRKDMINILIDQPIGKYEYSTIYEVEPDWEANPASRVYPFYPESDLNAVVHITASSPGGYQEVFAALQKIGVFGEYKVTVQP